MDQPQYPRHHLNAPGPFFVEKDCCISCRAPEGEAPDLMSYDDAGGSCYFHRQPETAEELRRAAMAVQVACCDAVKYGGNDPGVLALIRDWPKKDAQPSPHTQTAAGNAQASSRPWWRFWEK